MKLLDVCLCGVEVTPKGVERRVVTRACNLTLAKLGSLVNKSSDDRTHGSYKCKMKFGVGCRFKIALELANLFQIINMTHDEPAHRGVRHRLGEVEPP